MDRVAVYAQDVTERKRAEQALREREEQLRILFDQATDPIYVCDMEGKLVDVNERACQALGYAKAELLERNVDSVDAAIGNRENAVAILKTLERGHPQTLETAHRRKDGSTFPVELTIGLLDMPSYQDFMAGKLQELTYDESEIAMALSGLPSCGD